MGTPKDEKEKKEMTTNDHLVEYLYRETQRSVRKA